MQLYNQANAIDPYDAIARFMRGKARAITWDSKNAVDDFSTAIELPHLFPAVFGASARNEGIAALKRQINLQAKAEFYLRRALARSVMGDWRAIIDDDVRRVRERAQAGALAYEIEAFALNSLGGGPAAIASYEHAVVELKDAEFYGPEEFDKVKDPVWRNFKLANYKKRVGDIYQRTAHPEETAAAYAAAQQLIDDAYAVPDLGERSRALLDQFSSDPPEQRCGTEDRFRSVEEIQATQIEFSNQHSSPVRLYWLDHQGQRNLIATIDQGRQLTQRTFGTYPWLITDVADKCLAIYLSEIGASEFVIR
jgi:hypothetical protein